MEHTLETKRQTVLDKVSYWSFLRHFYSSNIRWNSNLMFSFSMNYLSKWNLPLKRRCKDSMNSVRYDWLLISLPQGAASRRGLGHSPAFTSSKTVITTWLYKAETWCPCKGYLVLKPIEYKKPQQIQISKVVYLIIKPSDKKRTSNEVCFIRLDLDLYKIYL